MSISSVASVTLPPPPVATASSTPPVPPPAKDNDQDSDKTASQPKAATQPGVGGLLDITA